MCSYQCIIYIMADNLQHALDCLICLIYLACKQSSCLSSCDRIMFLHCSIRLKAECRVQVELVAWHAFAAHVVPDVCCVYFALLFVLDILLSRSCA